MAKPQREKTEFIQPSIRTNGQQHVLEKLFTGNPDKMPVITSIGFAQLNDGPNSWVTYVIKSKGEKILSIQVEEPDLRDIAEETAKVAFVQHLIDPGAWG